MYMYYLYIFYIQQGIILSSYVLVEEENKTKNIDQVFFFETNRNINKSKNLKCSIT